MADERPDAWYATIEHYRAWLIADGGFEYDLKCNGGKFDAPLIRRMARYYGVARTIPGVDPVDVEGKPQRPDAQANRKIVAEQLNLLAKDWPASLADRATRVVATAEAIQGKIQKGRKPLSAVSKFIWFAQPKGWSLYDSLASKGLLSGGSGAKHLMAFYQALEDRNFKGHCETLRDRCKLGDCALWPERILDVVLMIRGSDKGDGAFADDLRANCKRFVELMPNGPALSKVADAVAETLPLDALRP